MQEKKNEFLSILAALPEIRNARVMQSGTEVAQCHAG